MLILKKKYLENGLLAKIRNSQIARMLIKEEPSYEEINSELLYKHRLIKSIFIIMIIIIGASINSISMLMFFKYSLPISHYVMILDTWGFIMLIFGIFILPYSPKYYGMNFFKWRDNIRIGLLYGIPLGVVAGIFRYILYKSGAIEFEFSWYFGITFYLYPLIAIVQEITMKGFIQSYFIKAFDGIKNNKFLAITISSLVFAQFHAIFGMPALLGTFLYAFLTGIIYERTRSVLGISIIHILTGMSLFAGSPHF